jgi:hypothetical protein
MFYNEAAFFEAWWRAVQLAGLRWFGDGHAADATSKWQLAPRVGDIEHNIGVLSHGEAVFLAALVSFYNARVGGELLKATEVNGLADIAAILDEPRRRVIADLLLAYAGW